MMAIILYNKRLSSNLVRTFHSVSTRNTCDVPNANRLIQRSRNDLILTRMEHGAHHVMIVTSQHRNASARLPVPDANCLIVGRRQNPRILMMEVCDANVVQMTKQCEHAAAFLVVPELVLNYIQKCY